MLTISEYLSLNEVPILTPSPLNLKAQPEIGLMLNVTVFRVETLGHGSWLDHGSSELMNELAHNYQETEEPLGDGR